jgi:hypothetical protein
MGRDAEAIPAFAMCEVLEAEQGVGRERVRDYAQISTFRVKEHQTEDIWTIRSGSDHRLECSLMGHSPFGTVRC